MTGRGAPSLLDLCVNTAIDNVKYLGDVGETDSYLLERILSHCTVDQLRHVEKSTQGRDLTPVTDKYWQKFYEKDFSVQNAKLVMRRMEKKNVAFTWMKLYEAKEKEVARAQDEASERLAKRYKDVDAKKQSRQVQICTKVPPGSKRSFFGGGGSSYNVGTSKSNIMKKAKLDFLRSNEVKNLTAMRKNAIQTNHRSYSSSSTMRPTSSPGKKLLPASKMMKPPSRRF